MISRQEAEKLAAEWSRRDTLRLGYQCTPMVDEFEFGYVIWSTVPPGVRTVPGDGPLTVVDKETGEVTTWPRLESAVVQEMYRSDRATRGTKIRTTDPVAELRRAATRTPTPGATAKLTVQHDLHVAHGAKGDLRLRHHPLVRSHLDGMPAGHLVRGAERHAELIVLSDVLHEYDRRLRTASQPALTVETARDLLSTSQLELFRVREPDDLFGGPAERPCESCIRVLAQFGVLPWSDLAFAEEWRPGPQPVPEEGRFPPEVGHALVTAGWRPNAGDELLARNAIAAVCATPGQQHRHAAFPAAERALVAFPGLVSARRGPGEQVWIRRFEINPRAVAHTADTLADVGALLGERLFPIGTENGDSILAVDERGRIFALDQAGEWFLGTDIDAALTGLLLGRAPARLHDDGSW